MDQDLATHSDLRGFGPSSSEPIGHLRREGPTRKEAGTLWRYLVLSALVVGLGLATTAIWMARYTPIDSYEQQGLPVVVLWDRWRRQTCYAGLYRNVQAHPRQHSISCPSRGNGEPTLVE
jgi:hypothetical protein